MPNPVSRSASILFILDDIDPNISSTVHFGSAKLSFRCSHFVLTVMALFRSASRFPGLVRQCTQLAAIQKQQTCGYAAMAFTFASSAESFYDKASVKQIDLATFSGNIGILPEHVPMLAVLKPGLIEVIEDNDVRKKFFASSGTVTVNDDSSVQILCEEACPIESLDAAAAKDGLSKAHTSLAAASSEAEKAEAQIAIDAFEALAKAAE